MLMGTVFEKLKTDFNQFLREAFLALRTAGVPNQGAHGHVAMCHLLPGREWSSKKKKDLEINITPQADCSIMALKGNAWLY